MRRKPALRARNRYEAILEKVFFDLHRRGAREIGFERRHFEEAARELGITLPKNLGDIIYSFRYRRPIPPSIMDTARKGHAWIIRPAGRGQYRFVQVVPLDIEPNPALTETKVPDATPGVIEMYALGDEQALLAKLRYNRLLDIFTGVACHSLQSHLRTTVPGLGQVETDEIYIGIDRRGAHYILTVQAKGPRDVLGAIQIEQDLALCQAKFPDLIPRLIGAQFMADEVIALFEFEETQQGIRIAEERHYRLVPPDQLTAEELATYRRRAE